MYPDMFIEREPPQLDLPASVNVTAGEEVTFQVTGRGARSSDVVSLNYTVPVGATFTIISGPASETTGVFSWIVPPLINTPEKIK